MSTDSIWWCSIHGLSHATEAEYRACLNEQRLSELTDSPLNNDEAVSFPDGQLLCLLVQVKDAAKTWMLIESLVGQHKLVAGCRVDGIQLVDKEKHRGIRIY